MVNVALKETGLEKRILAKSRLTEKDAEVIGHEMKLEIRKRFE